MIQIFQNFAHRSDFTNTLILLLLALCFITLNTILAHDNTNFSISVVVLEILSNLAPSKVKNIFDVIFLYGCNNLTIESGNGSPLSWRIKGTLMQI